jgi:hypothetical protein
MGQAIETYDNPRRQIEKERDNSMEQMVRDRDTEDDHTRQIFGEMYRQQFEETDSQRNRDTAILQDIPV